MKYCLEPKVRYDAGQLKDFLEAAMISDLQDALDSLKTVLDWTVWAATTYSEHELYFGHGTDNAWDEAVHTVCGALDLPWDKKEMVLNARLTAKMKQKIVDIVRQRVEKRVPLPYLLRKCWFMGELYEVDEHVLIPRSPFGEWIERQFEPWLEADDVHSILEIGTGSGCLAIACAKAFPDAEVDAVDISPEALAIAEKNVRLHQVEDQVHLLLSDAFSALGHRQYDLILSNPPYVSEEEWQSLPREYHHEPKLALVADDRGLSIVRELLVKARQHLTPEGILVVEVGNTEEAVVEAFPDVPFIWLEMEHGGHGVFLLTYEQLMEIEHGGRE